jgi:hypothetical protein
MPPSSLDHLRHINPSRAIDQRDVAALQACIDARWTPARRGPNPAVPVTYPLVDLVVFRGWGAGWELLRTRWPELQTDKALILRAFHRLQYVVLKDMWEQQALRLDQPVGNGKSALLLAQEGLYECGGRYSEQPGGDELTLMSLEERSILTFTWLKELGMDLYAPYPGEFHPQDDRIEGHSAWTLALYQMRFGLAYRLLPTDLADVRRQPKLSLGLSQLMEEAFSPHQDARQMALTLYAQWLDRFGDWWLQQPEARLLWDRTEWPLVLALSPRARRSVWAAWNRPQPENVTPLHLLALEAADRTVIPVLTQLLADEGEPVAWTHPSVEGVRPCDLWALCLGQPAPAAPWTLAEALEQTRQHGQGEAICPPASLLTLR